MSLRVSHKDVEFGIGDTVAVHLNIKEGEKERTQVFEGMVLAIKNRLEGKSITVRRIGAADIGIERIFPLSSPFVEKIEVVKKGTAGVRHAKLYYTREKSPREVAEIYARANRVVETKPQKKRAKKVKRARAKN